jgi:hypothetical protein
VRFLKVLSILIGIQILVISGCGSGGGGNNGATVEKKYFYYKYNISGLSTNICGFDTTIVFPTGATFVSAVPSGIAGNGSIVANNVQGNILTLALASDSPGFSSGEVATITFDVTGVAGNVQQSNFIISSFTPGNCL